MIRFACGAQRRCRAELDLQSRARFDLRAATREQHQRLDSAFSVLRLEASDDYLRFLTIHARIVPALERQVETGRPWSGWSPRAHLLQRDLASLGVVAPEPDEAVGPIDHAGRWGIQYVLEGSKLGGEVLSDRVASDLPQRYLSAGHGKGAWAQFQAELQAAAVDGGPGWFDSAAKAARSAFEQFEAALKIELETVRGR